MIDASLRNTRSHVLSAHTGTLLHGLGKGPRQLWLACEDAVSHADAVGLQLLCPHAEVSELRRQDLRVECPVGEGARPRNFCTIMQ